MKNKENGERGKRLLKKISQSKKAEKKNKIVRIYKKISGKHVKRIE